MKKIFIIALCFFFITSCSNNEVIESEEVQATEIENNQSDKNVEITTPEKKDPVEKIENNIISVEVMDFAEKREELFEMSKAELNNFWCPSLKNDDLESICFQLKKSNIITEKWVSVDDEIKISKKELNKGIEKGDDAICKKAYSDKEEIFDCKIGVVLSSDATCDVFSFGDKDKCEKIIEWVNFIKEYEQKKLDYEKYVQYLEQ